MRPRIQQPRPNNQHRDETNTSNRSKVRNRRYPASRRQCPDSRARHATQAEHAMKARHRRPPDRFLHLHPMRVHRNIHRCRRRAIKEQRRPKCDRVPGQSRQQHRTTKSNAARTADRPAAKTRHQPSRHGNRHHRAHRAAQKCQSQNAVVQCQSQLHCRNSRYPRRNYQPMHQEQHHRPPPRGSDATRLHLRSLGLQPRREPVRRSRPRVDRNLLSPQAPRRHRPQSQLRALRRSDVRFPFVKPAQKSPHRRD